MTKTIGDDPDDPRGPASPRLIAPRRALPNGRAVVGALLVTIAAVGAFTVATHGEREPGIDYLVVARDLDPGDPLSLRDVAFERMSLSEDMADHAITSTAGLAGATVLARLRAGEILIDADVHRPPLVDGDPVEAMHELTIPVARDRAPSALERGDRVTVLATRVDRHTLMALEDALVLGWEIDDGGIGTSGEGQLRLALPSAADVLRGAHLSFWDLTVVLSTGAQADEYPGSYEDPGTAVGLDPAPAPAPAERVRTEERAE